MKMADVLVAHKKKGNLKPAPKFKKSNKKKAANPFGATKAAKGGY